jgi:hypothetical protein
MYCQGRKTTRKKKHYRALDLIVAAADCFVSMVPVFETVVELSLRYRTGREDQVAVVFSLLQLCLRYRIGREDRVAVVFSLLQLCLFRDMEAQTHLDQVSSFDGDIVVVVVVGGQEADLVAPVRESRLQAEFRIV